MLLLTCVANFLMFLATAAANLGKPDAGILVGGFAAGVVVYLALTVPAALARRPTLFVVLVSVHIALYLASAAATAMMPTALEALAPNHPGVSAQ